MLPCVVSSMESDAERQLHGIVKASEQRSTISPDKKKGRKNEYEKNYVHLSCNFTYFREERLAWRTGAGRKREKKTAHKMSNHFLREPLMCENHNKQRNVSANI